MRPPTALTIAGSDSGGGAGIQADLKTFLDHRVYGMSVICALTAQNTRGVFGIHPVPVDFILAQLDAVFSDLPVDAIKIGMVGDAERIHAIADFLEKNAAGIPIVLDPVMVAKGGAPLLAPGAAAALCARLVPLATVVTPNMPEAEVLGELTGAAVLHKGGHGVDAQVVDTLRWPDGTGASRSRSWSHPRVDTPNTHGTGCTLSSAIAARLAHRDDLETACGRAIDYVAERIVRSGSLGHGHGPLWHGL